MFPLRFLLALLLLPSVLFARPAASASLEAEYAYPDYVEAEKAPNFFRFDMKSSKLGIITTSFTGFVKQFRVEGKHAGNSITNIHVSFKVKDMDTDVSGRNSKMWETCLDAERHPQIHIRVPGTIAENSEDMQVPAILELRGKQKQITIRIRTRPENGKLVAEGNAALSLKDLEVPDPSIAIASVKDEVNASFRVEIPESQERKK